MSSNSHPHSPYRQFTVAQWSRLRDSTPLPLTEAELERLRGLNEQASISEVERVYLPLSRLLSFYVAGVQDLHRRTDEFLRTRSGKVPFVIGLAGSVAVGKSTTGRILQALLARWPHHPKVDLVTTDGFLLPNRELERRGLMLRKGFPESFDRAAVLRFVADVKGGRRHVMAPVYSHLHYDVMPGQRIEVDRPDILIVEGLNVLQTEPLNPGEERLFVSDFFDFSIYLDAGEAEIGRWYVERFLALRETVFSRPEAYFRQYAGLSTEQAVATAEQIWRTINLPNLRTNIQPTRQRADLIIHKGADHAIDEVFLRKI